MILNSPISAIVCIVGFALSSVSAYAQGAGSVEPVPCPVALAAEAEIEGETYDCGVVLVPLDHADPDGRTIELVYLRLRSTTLSPAPDPMVYLSGGPGGSALHEVSSNPVLNLNMTAARQRRDVIFYDQRGTGYSTLLACGPFNAAVGVVGELYADQTGIGIEQLEDIGGGARADVLTLSICAAGYKGAGFDISQINSVASAQDIAMLTTALGYEGTYNLYGTSYGTRLALNGLRSTPERIRTVILDGVVPPVIPGSAYTTAKVGESYSFLFDLCAADDFCAENFPDLRDRFIALLGELQAEPMRFDPPLVPNDLMRYQFGLLDQIGPEFFADLAELNNKAARGGFAARIPVLIDAVEARDETAVRDLLGHGPVDDTPIQATASAEDAFAKDDMFIAPAIDVIFARALDRDGEETTISEDWVTLVVGDFAARLTAGEEAQAVVVEDMVDLAMVPLAGSNPDALTAFADTHLSHEVAVDADALVATMSRQQVRETMWAIQDLAATMSGGSERAAVSLAVLYNINCAEDIGFTPVEEAQAYIDASPYPGLLTFGIEDYENMTLFCRFFPAPFTKEEMMSPVESDTPALLFLEGLDTHTAYSFGLVAAESLPNSHIVTWPSEGHVMAARSVDGCAGAIAATFLDDPSREPDIGCSQVDYYTLPFQSATESWSGFVKK